MYVILPELPSYFWGELYEVLLRALSARGISAKYNIYSKLVNQKTVETYLEEAERLDAKCIIIAANGDRIGSRISQLAKDRAVFSVCSRPEGDNVFYFGSNHREDGFKLGQKCLELLPESRVYAFIGEDEERRQGFLEAIGDRKAIHVFGSSEVPPYELARRVAMCCQEQNPDAIVSLDGTNARVMMALKKCGITAPTFGFEDQDPDDRYQKVEAKVCQDLEKTAEAVAEAAERYLLYRTYPVQKNCFIPTCFK